MELKLFTDLLDALGKVVTGVTAVARLPRNERDKFREVMGETYRLLDTTLNMVIIRLGDILLAEHKDELLAEVVRLGNCSEWMQAEREFRLCTSLRVALRETEALADKLAGAVSVLEWRRLLQEMKSVLATEREIADFVGTKFCGLADAARAANRRPEAAAAVRTQVMACRDALIQERQDLIKQETELFGAI